MKEQLNHIRKLLGRHEKLPDVFQQLEGLLEEHLNHRIPQLQSLRVSFEKNEEEYSAGAGTIHRDDYLRELRRTIQAIGQLLNIAEKDFERFSSSGISLRSELSRFCCDRNKIIRRFWLRFEEKEKQGACRQFYFLAARPESQPDSLVKRIITELNKEKPLVHYPGFNKLNIFKLEVGKEDGLQDTQFFFRKNFNREVRPHINTPQVNGLQEFVHAIDKHYPDYKGFHYIPLALKIIVEPPCLEHTVPELLHWLYHDFCALGQPLGRQFILFIILKVKQPAQARTGKSFLFGWGRKRKAPDFDEEPLKKVLSDLEGSAFPEVTVLPALGMVNESDLHDWFERFEKNEYLRKRKVEELIQRLPGDGPWEMAKVEAELARVVAEYCDLDL